MTWRTTAPSFAAPTALTVTFAFWITDWVWSTTVTVTRASFWAWAAGANARKATSTAIISRPY